MATGVDQVTASPFKSVDFRGRALRKTDAEIRVKASEIARRLDALDNMGSQEEQEETLNTLMKAIDEEPLSDRKRFD